MLTLEWQGAALVSVLKTAVYSPLEPEPEGATEQPTGREGSDTVLLETTPVDSKRRAACNNNDRTKRWDA